MADDQLSEGPGFVEPLSIPGNFTEATPPPVASVPKSPLAPQSPGDALTERTRLNFEASRGAAGALSAAGAKTASELPVPGPDVPKEVIDFAAGKPFVYGGKMYAPPEAVEAARKSLEDIEADQIAYKSMPGFSGAAEGAAAITGALAGGMTTPENLVFPQIKLGSAIWRASHPFIADIFSFGLGQAAVQAVADPVKQLAELKAGLRKDYSFKETSIAVPMGFAFGGGITAAQRGASILYKTGVEAFAGRLTKGVDALNAELRPPTPPEPQPTPTLRDTTAAPVRRTNSEAAAVKADIVTSEPPVPEGMTRLYRADAPGAAAGDAPNVGFTTDRAKAGETPALGAAPGERTQVSFIDVPENTAIARSSGDQVFLPDAFAAKRAPVPEEAPPAAAAAESFDRDAALARLDELEIALQTTPGKAKRAEMQAEIDSLVQKLEAKPKTDTAGRKRTMAEDPNSAAPRDTSRPAGGVASTVPTEQLTPVETLASAMRRMASTLDIIVRKGGAGKGNVASYNFSTQITRLNSVSPNSFVDFGHELGHHVENVVGRDITRLISANEPVMRAFGGPTVQGMRTAEGVSEGFGEFLSGYITNRVATEQRAPQFVQQFRDVLERKDPALLDAVDDLHRTWEAYQSAPSRANTMVVSHTEMPKEPPANDPLKRGPVALWVSNLYTEWVNRQHPIAVAQRYLAEVYEKKFGHLLDLPPDRDPAKLMQMFARGGHQMTVMDLTHGVQNAHTLNPEGPSFFSILRRATADPITGAEAADGAAAAARLRAFDDYLVARWHRALREQMRRGESDLTRPPTRMTDGDATTKIAEYEQLHPEFPNLAEEVYAYNKLLVQKEFDSGTRTRESLDELMHPRNHEYVPLRRDMRDITETIKKSGGDVPGGLETLGQHRLRGSDRDVMSPTESIMLRNFTINDQMTENWTKLALRDLVRLVGGKEGAAIAEEIPNTVLRRMDIDAEEALFKAAKDNGWLSADARDMAREVMSEIGPQTRVQLYRSQAITAGSRPIIFGWDGGERFAMQLPDGQFGRQIQEVMDSLGPRGVSAWSQASGVLVDLLASTASTLRAGATGTPTFMVKNTLRDAFVQFLTVPEADWRAISGVNFAKGATSYLRGDDFYRMYVTLEGVRGGVAANTIGESRKIEDLGKQIYGRRLSADIQNARADIAESLGQAGVERHKMITFDNTKDALRAMEISESAGRVGLFRTIYEQNIAAGRSPRYAMFDAAHKARDFIDYGRFGSRMEGIMRLVPFLNANIQGVDKFMRTYAGSPANPGLFFAPKTEQQKLLQDKLRATMIPRATALASISAAIAMYYSDDEAYQRIPVQARSQYWIFRVPFVSSGKYSMLGGGEVDLPEGMQGAWMFIPKPWEISSLFNLAERAVEFVNTGDEAAIGSWGKSLRYSFSLPNPYEFPLLRTAQGLASNYDTFFQRPIVPDHMHNKIAPHLQSNEFTNKFYVSVAQGLNAVWNSKDARTWFRENMPMVGAAIGAAWSPMEAQYLMQGVFGDWPRELGGIGGVLRSVFTGEDIKVSDIPGVRALVKDKMAAGEPLRELYNQVGQNGGRLTVAENTFKQAIANGDPSAAQSYFSSLDDNQRDYVRLKTTQPGPLATALHPLDRTANLATVVRNVSTGLLSDAGLATLNDPAQRIKLEPGLRDVVRNALNEVVAAEARNGLIVQGAPGYKNLPLVPTKPYFAMIEQASPELARELSARMAQKKVFDIETVRDLWPQVKRTLRIGGEPADLARDLRGVGLDAAARGYLGGGIKSGRGAADSAGQKIKRGKAQFPMLPAEAGVNQ